MHLPPDQQPPLPRPTWRRQRSCALHRPQGIRVAALLIVSFLEAPQVRIEAIMARKRLCLSIQPSGKLRD